MAIDTSLIKGAEFAATGGSPTGGYIDPAKYLSPGIKKFTDQIEAGIKKSEDAFASLMDDFDSYVDLSRLSDNQLSTAKNWLVDKKRKYSDIASKLSTMQRTDPKYSELTDELNRIQGAINTFAQQKKAYITNRIKMKDSDFDEYSRVDPKKVENYASMYKNSAGFTVDETGNMIFKGVDGEDIPYYLREEPPTKAINQANIISNISIKLNEAAKTGEEPSLSSIKLKINELIPNVETAKSLLQDKLLSEEIYFIDRDFKTIDTNGNKEIDDDEYLQQARKFLADAIYNSATSEYKPKPVELSAAQEKNAIQNQIVENFVETNWGKTDSINIDDDFVVTRTGTSGETKYTLMKKDKDSDTKDADSKDADSNEETLANQVFSNKEMFKTWLRLYLRNK